MSDERISIKDKVLAVKERIAAAAARSGRNQEDITLIAVSKTISIDKITEALEAGIIHLGENKVQELSEKYDSLGRSCNWHLIGHLQTNKVKYLIDKVELIHSLDRIELAEEIQKRAEKLQRIVKVLLQVNVSGEESKFGIAPEQAISLLKQVSTFRNVKVKGLMTIAPYAEDPEDTRPVFRDLKKIFIDIKKENIDNIDMDLLSMGMSNDYEIAIEEGSNMIRVGTAIFGGRVYNK